MRLLFLGTAIGSSGVLADGDGRVLGETGDVIPGLYAIGSCAATTTFGSGYNSGMALSRGLTSAYLVSQHLATAVAAAREWTLDVLVVTGGHRVDFDALFEMMAAICEPQGWRWTHAVQPSAQRWLVPSMAGRWDAILTHDIPGLRLRRGTPPTAEGPSTAVRRALVELLQTRPRARRHASLARRMAGVGGLGGCARWTVPLRAGASPRA